MIQIEFTPNYIGTCNITYTKDKETYTIVNPVHVKSKCMDNKVHIFISPDSTFVTPKELIADVEDITFIGVKDTQTKYTDINQVIDIINKTYTHLT